LSSIFHGALYFNIFWVSLAPDVILMAVRWYCRLPLSAAQVVRLLAERNIGERQEVGELRTFRVSKPSDVKYLRS
jgi:hypothetical protein